MLTLRSNRLLEAEVVEGGARVVVCETHLDAVRAQALGEYLLDLAGRMPGGRLEVDLSGVRDLCSSGLGKLVALDRRLRAAGGRLTFREVNAAVYEVFEITHLTGVLEIHAAA